MINTSATNTPNTWQQRHNAEGIMLWNFIQDQYITWNKNVAFRISNPLSKRTTKHYWTFILWIWVTWFYKPPQNLNLCIVWRQNIVKSSQEPIQSLVLQLVKGFLKRFWENMERTKPFLKSRTWNRLTHDYRVGSKKTDPLNMHKALVEFFSLGLS